MNLQSQSKSQPQSQLNLKLPSKPQLSFVINNYNYGQFLKDAISSALAQKLESEQIFEVIVVDDGSIDHSDEIMTSFGDRIVPVFKANGGQASAFNAGFAASSGDWICFLDADDVVRSDKAQAILQAAADAPQAKWIFHPLQPVQADLKPLIAVDELPHLAHGIDVTTEMQHGKLNSRKLPFPIPATSGLCIHRSLLSQILPMPESDGISLNDTYLQFTAMGTAPGIFLAHTLACQRYHGNNAFVTARNSALNARIFLLTAYWLQYHFKSLERFSQALFARAISERWRSNTAFSPDETQMFHTFLDHLPRRDRFRLYSKALYRYLRP